MYGDSHALSSDKFGPNLKPKGEGWFSKNYREHNKFLFMESDSNTNNNNYNSSGLLRYRSAPISFLANFSSAINGAEIKSEIDLGSNTRFFSSDSEGNNNNMNVFDQENMNSQLPPRYPRQSGQILGSSGDYRVVGSKGMEQGKMGSSLVRQNSSPAGLFSHLSPQNGIRGIGSYRVVDGGANGTIFPSSLGALSRILEVENENGGAHGLNDPKVGNSASNNLSFFSSRYPTFGSWNDSSHFAENLTGGIKRELDDDQKLFVHTQCREPGNRPHILSHHLSLPKTSSAETTFAMEKFLQLQDTVPCKIRAKRGCATHPRSIAERIRRTRISERMRKLQELVPNMDKQTNTADMLDLAVEYIKSLQRQYKILSDNRANCKCSASQKVVLNQAH